MSENTKDKSLELVEEITVAIAEEHGLLNDGASGTHQAPPPPAENDGSPAENSGENDGSPTENSGEKQRKKRKDNSPKKPTFKDIEKKKQNQHLHERKVLLIIMSILLGLQLLFMNLVVLLIVMWCAFDFKCFRGIDANVLSYIFEFSKYYITAVLVELLGGIIYIVHSVFSAKD